MFIEHMLDKNKIMYNKKTIISKNVKTFFTKIIVKLVII